MICTIARISQYICGSDLYGRCPTHNPRLLQRSLNFAPPAPPLPVRVYLIEHGSHFSLREPLGLRALNEEGHHRLLEALELRRQSRR